MNRRAGLLLGALGLTLAATWWAGSLDEGAPAEAVVEAVQRSAGGITAPGARPAPGMAVSGGARAPWPAEVASLMPGPSLAIVSAPLADVAVPEPVAPPLPFRFVGMLEEGGVRTVIVLEGPELHLLRARDQIDERYRVDRITPTRVEFTYLPLGEQQVLETDDHEQEAE